MMDKKATPLIPRQVLFGNPDRAQVRLSPDGRYISFLAPLAGVLNVWVGPSDNPAAARAVTADTVRGIRTYAWAYTSRHVLYLQDKGGDENWRLHVVDLESGTVTDLTPFEGVRARVEHLSLRFPTRVMVGLNDRDPALHDLYLIDIETGERELVLQNEGYAVYEVDHSYSVRLAVKMTPDGGQTVYHRLDDGSWEPYLDIPMADALTTFPITYDASGEQLYVQDSRDRDTAALYVWDAATRTKTLLAQDTRADSGQVLWHPQTRAAQAVAFVYQRQEWRVLDDDIAPDLACLATVSHGDVQIVSRTLADNDWIVAYLLDDGPVAYYHYHRQNKQATFLFTSESDLEGLELASMHSVVIRSRDGLDLVSYYSLPVGSDSRTPGIPDAPLPMVLDVHGGPWGRDSWGYNPLHQWLANRGYAVLSVNFRASTGFGKAFVNAGNLAWGAQMHEDLLDAVAWAVDQGIAAPERVAIMGGSYGGYATLAGLTMTPDVFACGVNIVGPSNLVTLLETIPPYWKPQIELFTTRVGDHRTEEGRAFLASRSPLTYADRMVRPLLIGQGANDPRVKQAESGQDRPGYAKQGHSRHVCAVPGRGTRFRPTGKPHGFLCRGGGLSWKLSRRPGRDAGRRSHRLLPHRAGRSGSGARHRAGAART